jgi:hypothetical protein
MFHKIHSEKLELFERDTLNPQDIKENIKLWQNNNLEKSYVLIDKKYYYIGDESVAKKTNQIFFNSEALKDFTKSKYNLPDGCKVSVNGDCLCTETLFNPYKSLHDSYAILKLHLLNSTNDEYDFRNALYQNIVLTGGNYWLDEIQNNLIVESQIEIKDKNSKQEKLNKEFLILLNGCILVSK